MEKNNILAVYNSESAEETKEIAKEIVLNEIKRLLEKNKEDENKNLVLNIILNGDLAAGKTKFVEGVLEIFKMENEISSPTFTIVNEYFKDLKYKVEDKEIILSLNHFDVYRLEDEDEFYESGLQEYIYPDEENEALDKSENIKIKINLIEWGIEIENVYPKPFIIVDIEKPEPFKLKSGDLGTFNLINTSNINLDQRKIRVIENN